MRSDRFMISVDSWPMMVARLLLAAAAADDAESRLSQDLIQARRLATLLGEGAEINAALSRTLIEAPPGEETLAHVEVALAEWGRMRAQLFISAVGVAGSAAAACSMLAISRRRLRREWWRARAWRRVLPGW